MITEDYCSSDIAILIKEKGLVFAEHTKPIPKYNDDGTIGTIATITHQTAMKWLRKKGYHIYTDYSSRFGVWIRHIRELNTGVIWSLGGYSSHEEAVDAALMFTLECLIEP